MHFYFVTGEASGDLYASRLIQSMREKNPNINITGWGGHHMLSQGVELKRNIKNNTYYGFFQVILNLKKIKQDLLTIEKDLQQEMPTAVVLIDYAGFNLRVAKIAKTLGIPVYWFVAPQVWVWRQYRIRALKRYVSELFVILPFEPDFYKQHALNCTYYGHPLLDLVADYRRLNTGQTIKKQHIALLPGSRQHEVERLLPIMLAVTKHFPQELFTIAATSNVERILYQDVGQHKNVQLIYDNTYGVLQHAKAALVASGTAALEVALFKVPQIVCYQLGFVTYALIRMLLSLKYCSLVNIIANKSVIKELLQQACNENNLSSELKALLQPAVQKKIMSDYEDIILQLGSPGCFKRVAEKIINLSVG